MKRGISKQISRGMKYQQRKRDGASASASTSSTALTFQQHFVVSVSQKEEQLEEQEQSIVTSKRRLSSYEFHNGIGMMKMRMKRSLCIAIHNNIRSTNQHQSRWFSSQAQQHVAESHEAPSVTNNTDNTISANGTNITLKKLVRPFLLKFHPDRQHMDSNGTASNNTTLAREVNLQAIQTLNGMIDTIDQIYTRARASSANRKGSRIELASSYNIEFLVTSSSSDHSSGSGIRKKKKHAPMASRRSVDLTFPARIVQSIHQIHPQTGNYSLEAATELRWRAMKEIVKLLRVAGLDVSPDLLRGIDTNRNRSSNRTNNSRSLLEDELDFSANANANANSRPQTPYEQSRSRYMQSMNWKEYNKIYDAALKDMEKDMATEGLIAMSEERKMRMVSGIISRVRILDTTTTAQSSQGQGQDNFEDGKGNGDGDGMDAVSQLIAIRRLSLLFSDNFDHLEMEEMGRLWETMVIVLTPERMKGLRGGGSGEYGNGKGLPYSRLRRLKRGRESGFKFAFHSDSGADGATGTSTSTGSEEHAEGEEEYNNSDEGEVSRVTVYIPIDFLDDELLGEMKVHLADFHFLCLSRGELEDVFPASYRDFRGQANFDD